MKAVTPAVISALATLPLFSREDTKAIRAYFGSKEPDDTQIHFLEKPLVVKTNGILEKCLEPELRPLAHQEFLAVGVLRDYRGKMFALILGDQRGGVIPLGLKTLETDSNAIHLQQLGGNQAKS